MKLPNWFKIFWWLLVFGAVSAFLVMRFPELVSGKGNTVDIFLLLLWFSLALVPIFQEIDFLGLKFKQEIKSLKSEVDRKISILRTEISTNIRSDFNPQINIPYPTPDSQLPSLENQIKDTVNIILRERGISDTSDKVDFSLSKNIQYLFSVRLGIEKEVRRIWKTAIKEGWVSEISILGKNQYLTLGRIIDILTRANMLNHELGTALKKVYAVCSPAIHGEPVTDAQVSFVKDVASSLMTTLKTIE